MQDRTRTGLISRPQKPRPGVARDADKIVIGQSRKGGKIRVLNILKHHATSWINLLITAGGVVVKA